MTTTSRFCSLSAITALAAAGILIPVPALAAPGTLSEAGAPPTVTVDYTASTEVIPNPERGFDHTKPTHAVASDGSDYEPLTVALLTGYRAENITQVVRVFYLERFVDGTPLDATYLALVQADFDAARAAGVSLIPRFAYKEGGADYAVAPYGDADLPVVLSHIAQLKPLLQRNADVIAVMQSGFVGTWGEGYFTDHFASDPDDLGTLTDEDWAKRRAVIDALLVALPADRMVQVRTMLMKQVIEQVPTGADGALTAAQAYDGSDLARVGHHNDCLLASPDDYGTFLSNPIELDQQYLELDSRYVAVGGETCSPNPPRSEFPSASAEMARYHYSYLNIDYEPRVLASWGTAGVDETARRLGYRFVMQQSRVTGATVALDVRNDGWAAPYNPRSAQLVLTGSAGEFRVPLATDVRAWAPGSVSTVSASACTLPAGTYAARLALPSASASLASDPRYAIQTANTGTWDAATGLNSLGQTVTVSAAACSGAAPTTATPVAATRPELAATGAGPATWWLAALAAATLGSGVALVARARRRTELGR